MNSTTKNFKTVLLWGRIHPDEIINLKSYIETDQFITVRGCDGTSMLLVSSDFNFPIDELEHIYRVRMMNVRAIDYLEDLIPDHVEEQYSEKIKEANELLEDYFRKVI